MGIGLEYAFLADAATVADTGVFCVIGGGLDVLKAGGFPATKHALALVARINLAPEQLGQAHDLHVEIVGPDGKAVPPDMHIPLRAAPHPRNPLRPGWVVVVVRYEGVTFPAPGDYSFRLSVGGQSVGQVTLEAVAQAGPGD